MELSKSKLLSIINESIEMDEMAKWENPISRPLKDKEGNLIGHDMRVNPNDENSPRVNVIFTCDIEKFMAENPELIQELKQQYGNIKWSDDVCPKYNPHRNRNREYYPLPGEDDDKDIVRRPYQPSGEEMAVREKILRYSGGNSKEGFLNLLRSSIFNDEEIKNRLEICSVPPIKADRVNINKYSDINNTGIVFTTHSLDFYGNLQTFLNAVVTRVKGKTPQDVRRGYLARLFNLKYNNWDIERKTDKNFYGYTPKYNLKKWGYEPDDVDAIVSMFFTIQGNIIGRNGYTWHINLITKFGRKLKEDNRVKNLTEDKNIDVIVNVPEDNEDNREFNSEFTVMDKLSIKQGLLEAVEEFKRKLMNEIKPKDALALANIKQYDIQKTANPLNETVINKIIDNVVKEQSQQKLDPKFNNFPCILKQNWFKYDLNKDGVIDTITPDLNVKKYTSDGIVHIFEPGNKVTKKRFKCVGDKVVDDFVKNPKFKTYKGSPFIEDGGQRIPVFVTDNGSNGNIISQLQQKLIEKGYLRIKKPTGNYGRLTQQSIVLAAKKLMPGSEANQSRGITKELYDLIMK